MIEEKIREFDKKFGQDARPDEEWKRFEKIKSFLLSFYKQLLEEDIETLFMEKNTMKDTHICRFNDGDQNCDCYNAALSSLIDSKREALNKLKAN